MWLRFLMQLKVQFGPPTNGNAAIGALWMLLGRWRWAVLPAYSITESAAWLEHCSMKLTDMTVLGLEKKIFLGLFLNQLPGNEERRRRLEACLLRLESQCRLWLPTYLPYESIVMAHDVNKVITQRGTDLSIAKRLPDITCLTLSWRDFGGEIVLSCYEWICGTAYKPNPKPRPRTNDIKYHIQYKVIRN